MVAQRLDGNAIAKAIRERIAGEIAEKQQVNPRYKPCLKIIQGESAVFSEMPSSAIVTDRQLLTVGVRPDSSK